jgi:uncharacterized repeat protein (TIGR03837 family)
LPSLDIFCRVVDNFGDAGVCWRLAQRMQAGFGWQVRLFIDRPALLDALVPQRGSTITVNDWTAAETAAPAQVVIEAFACDPPAAYVTRMAQAPRPPVWLNLEYFTAEPFAQQCHGLPSPQRNGLAKWFFFPGVTAGTGGLIGPASAPSPAPAAGLQILLFCYPYAPYPQLLAELEGTAATLSIAAGLDAPWHARNLRVQTLDFLPQAQFDSRIAGAALAFVRGEDSIARALLAGVPFVWNIYRQEADAHLPKLHALLDWWCDGLAAPAADALRRAHLAWNLASQEIGAFAALLPHLPALGDHAQARAQALATEPDLGSRLSDFVQKKLNS